MGAVVPSGIAFATVAILALLTLRVSATRSPRSRIARRRSRPRRHSARPRSRSPRCSSMLGLRLIELPVALAASALAGLGGLALFLLVRQRQRDRHATA